jgi:hypothetical protein
MVSPGWKLEIPTFSNVRHAACGLIPEFPFDP